MSHRHSRFDEPIEPTEFAEAVAVVKAAVHRDVCEPLGRAIEDGTAQFVSDVVNDAARSFGDGLKGVLELLCGESEDDEV